MELAAKQPRDPEKTAAAISLFSTCASSEMRL